MVRSIFFSIIIPTYNSEEKLRKALGSIHKQTFKAFEVIVCDDGSTDNTKETVACFNNKMEIKYLWEENCGGPARPRNNGLRIAKGEFIAFLDADDWWYPCKLGFIKKCLHKGDVFYHDLDIYTTFGKKLFKKVKGRRLKTPIFADLMKNENALITSSVIIRKSIVDQTGYFDEDRELISVEDFDLWLRLARLTEKFVYIPAVLGAYWLEGNNISKASQLRIKQIQAVYAKHLPNLDETQQKKARQIMNYLIGRNLVRIGLHREALNRFRISLFSTNYKYAMRSVIWLILSFLKTVFKKERS